MKDKRPAWYYRRDHWLSRILDKVLLTDLLAMIIGASFSIALLYAIQGCVQNNPPPLQPADQLEGCNKDKVNPNQFPITQ